MNLKFTLCGQQGDLIRSLRESGVAFAGKRMLPCVPSLLSTLAHEVVHA
jgi:hypothetical protein